MMVRLQSNHFPLISQIFSFNVIMQSSKFSLNVHWKSKCFPYSVIYYWHVKYILLRQNMKLQKTIPSHMIEFICLHTQLIVILFVIHPDIRSLRSMHLFSSAQPTF